MSNVSEVTQQLKDIININDLQDVWIRGKISGIKTIQNGPLVFMLRDNSEKIECVIFEENAWILESLQNGDDALVKGRISLHLAKRSQYRFVIEDKQPLGTVSTFTSVSKLIKTFHDTVKDHSAKVQGKIANNPNVGEVFCQLHLKNANNTEMIVCVLPPHIARPPFRLEKGAEVSIHGKFDIFRPMLQYQIKIASPNDIQLVSEDGQTIVDTETKQSTAGLLKVSEDGQTIVDAVHVYLDTLKTDGFLTEKEHKIQFGSRSGFADVVLVDRNGSFAAIAECKGAGYVGHGIEQLKSYLSATDTRFGVFANSTEPDSWSFFENLGRNQCPEIDRSKFEEGVVKGITLRKQLKDEIKSLESDRNQLHAEIDELKTEKADASAQVRQESQTLDAVKQAIKSDQKRLNDTVEQLETEKTKLEAEVAELKQKEHLLRTSHERLKDEIIELENQKYKLETKVDQITQTKCKLTERASNLKQEIGTLEDYKAKLHQEILRKLDELFEEKMQRLERPLLDLQKRGIINWFKNLFSKENK